MQSFGNYFGMITFRMSSFWEMLLYHYISSVIIRIFWCDYVAHVIIWEMLWYDYNAYVIVWVMICSSYMACVIIQEFFGIIPLCV